MHDRKRILILSHFYPYAPVSGAAIRIFNTVQNLSPHFDIYFLAFIDRLPPQNDDQLHYLCSETILVGRGIEWRGLLERITAWIWRSLKVIFLFRNPTIEGHNSRRFRKALGKVLHDHDFDLAIIESSWMAQYISFIKRRRPSCLAILDLYDLNCQLMKEEMELETNVFSKFYRWFSYFTMKYAEKNHMKLADAVLVVSEVEKEKAKALSPSSNFIELSNYITMEKYEGYEAGGLVRNSLVFTGWMAASFNESAMLHFYKEILPLVRQKGYDPIVYIVGGYPTKKIRDLASADSKITVTGFVPDVRPFIAKSDVFIAPHREGSGTRIKILEALAMRKPVVATSKGCEGLCLMHEKHILIADEPGEFADAIIRLFHDVGLRERLAENGSELVRSHYSSKYCGRRLVDIVETISIHKR